MTAWQHITQAFADLSRREQIGSLMFFFGIMTGAAGWVMMHWPKGGE